MNKYIYSLIILPFILLKPFTFFAQTGDTAIVNPVHVITGAGSAKEREADSLDRQMDILDFIDTVFKFHLSSKSDTAALKPGKLLLAIVPAVGYTLQNSWLASLATNISLYTANPESTNLSTITFGIQYTARHQVIAPLISDVWLKNNTIDLLGDWRFYRYPSYTYGLGGNTVLSDADLVAYTYYRFYQEILFHFNSYYYLGGGINYDNHFGITQQGNNASFEAYNNGAAQTISSGPVVHFMYDSRTNINNPRNAFYGSITYRYNTPALGSTQSWQSIFVELKKYIQLSPSSPNVLALWSWNVFTFAGNTPYFDLPSTGWDENANSGRGYIQGRFRGKNMLYDEAEYRFGITKNGLLGGVVFVNAESVTNYPNNKFQDVDPGEGAGVRIKVNKYSDVNLCFDYGFGLMGSRGFFFNLGEVF